MRRRYGSTEAWTSDVRNVPRWNVLSGRCEPVHRVLAKHLHELSRVEGVLGVPRRKHRGAGRFGLHADPQAHRVSASDGRFHRWIHCRGGLAARRHGMFGGPSAVGLDAFGVLRSQRRSAFGASTTVALEGPFFVSLAQHVNDDLASMR